MGNKPATNQQNSELIIDNQNDLINKKPQTKINRNLTKSKSPQQKKHFNKQLPSNTQLLKSHRNVENKSKIQQKANIIPKQQSIQPMPMSVANQQIDLISNQHYNASLYKIFQAHKNINLQTIDKTKFSTLITNSIQKSKNKFLKKLKNKQIELIFTQINASKTLKDLILFQMALKIRVYKYFSQNHQNLQGQHTNISQKIDNQIILIGNGIIAQLMGKTKIWKSLMIKNQQQHLKIIQMLRQQGISQNDLSCIN